MTPRMLPSNATASTQRREGDQRHLVACRHVLSKQVLVAFLCYIDRSSISFAAPQLTQQLGFSTADYGFGAGIFFVGYTCLQASLSGGVSHHTC